VSWTVPSKLFVYCGSVGYNNEFLYGVLDDDYGNDADDDDDDENYDNMFIVILNFNMNG
jgi:hypothetical protein